MSNLKRNATNSTSGGGGLLSAVVEDTMADVFKLRAHPDNIYSMDGIEQLADNIATVGLIHPPLVRRVDDGGFQILSGHRRWLAYKHLAKIDPDVWSKIPVRVVGDISDEDAVLILDSGNEQRKLSKKELVARDERMRERIAVLRPKHPEWDGVRTDRIMATLLGIPQATYYRLNKIARNLDEGLYAYYDRDLLGTLAAYNLSQQDANYQKKVAKYLDDAKPNTKKETEELVNSFTKGIAEHLKDAETLIRRADVSLFYARQLMRNQKRITPENLDRLEAMYTKIGKMLGK